MEKGSYIILVLLRFIVLICMTIYFLFNVYLDLMCLNRFQFLSCTIIPSCVAESVHYLLAGCLHLSVHACVLWIIVDKNSSLNPNHEKK